VVDRVIVDDLDPFVVGANVTAVAADSPPFGAGVRDATLTGNWVASLEATATVGVVEPVLPLFSTLKLTPDEVDPTACVPKARFGEATKLSTAPRGLLVKLTVLLVVWAVPVT
jgi:hypothetical protein